jgi:hypothetical protein
MCALQANMNRRPGKKPFEPKDFMPFMPKPEQDIGEAEEAFLAFAKAFNAKAKPQ